MGLAPYKLSRSLGVTQKTAWFMLHRIRKAMEVTGDAPKLGGKNQTVQVDETFIGGQPKNFHPERRERMRRGVRSERVQMYNGTYGHQIAVMGMNGKYSREIRAKVVPNVRRDVLQKEILATIEWGSTLHTDEARSYKSLKDKYVHETVNHAMTYVRGNVHTNSLENFWSLLKRNLKGTYVAVSRFIWTDISRSNARPPPLLPPHSSPRHPSSPHQPPPPPPNSPHSQPHTPFFSMMMFFSRRTPTRPTSHPPPNTQHNPPASISSNAGSSFNPSSFLYSLPVIKTKVILLISSTHREWLMYQHYIITNSTMLLT